MIKFKKLKSRGVYMEILDVYDKYKTLTGKKILKGQYNELLQGEYTFLFSSKG